MRTTKLFTGYIFVSYRFYYVWPGDKHIGSMLHHKYKISNSRRINRTTRAWPHDSRYLRHDA